ncbi:hypothetical protein AYK25_01585 [Thermoplasmatales archaeon SM1-50]|nr:MAG: hypothetical protein AYK25_01585 [Thermoplasmatales archaeon SM1-50]
MKKIIPFLIVGVFLISGLQCMATEKKFKLDTEFPDLSNDSEIFIAPISQPCSPDYQMINKNGEHTNEEPEIHLISYRQNSKNITDNREIEKQWTLNQKQNNIETYNYVIITVESLYNAITSSAFIGWKTLLGHTVKIFNITDTEIASQNGQDLPEKIRNFLRVSYQELGIEYVLLIGDHATIPMRYCYPDPTNHRFDIFDWTSGEVPTDYYYADLSSGDADSWDLDGDGYYGEYGQDSPDFFPEVYIGRIPTSISTRITYTLDKITSFEQDSTEWKTNALNAGSFFYFTNEGNSGNPAMDGATLSYYIENDTMTNWSNSHYSEQQGLETSVYPWPPLSETALTSDWLNGQYSVVNWQGHGWTNRAARKVWEWDDGDNVPEASEISFIDFININSNLDDDYPSIVTAESCYVGCPEASPTGNLGIDLLTDPSMGASIGVIASARSPYGTFDWPNNPGGSDSILFEFNRFLINDSKTVGEALYNAKYFCNLFYGWDHYAEYLDMYTFNLFGEPSLVLKGISVENLPPDTPTITGPAQGKIKVAIQYNFTAIDPNGDEVSYFIEWGDGTDSDWIGPYNSGCIIIKSHTWSTKGDYIIRVKAKDSNGDESDWGTLTVTMPYSFNRPTLQFLKVLFERFPNAFPFLRQLLGY